MKVGIEVYCAMCHRTKAPRGRSVPDMSYNQFCTGMMCSGYGEDPIVGDLWPGETEQDFGYPLDVAGTKEVSDAAKVVY